MIYLNTYYQKILFNSISYKMKCKGAKVDFQINNILHFLKCYNVANNFSVELPTLCFQNTSTVCTHIYVYIYVHIYYSTHTMTTNVYSKNFGHYF